MKRIFGVLAALIFCVSVAQAQQYDSMWVECPCQPYGAGGTYCLPVYVQLGPSPPTPPGGVTAMQVMFCNSAGVTILSIEWDNDHCIDHGYPCPCMGGCPETAIETYIGSPPVWSMNNAGATYRGGAATFTFANEPKIPAPGTYLLCYLVVSMPNPGTYSIWPCDGVGSPPITNSMAYKLTASILGLAGCEFEAVPYEVVATCPGPQTVDECNVLEFDVTGTSTEAENVILALKDVTPPITCPDSDPVFVTTPDNPATGTLTWHPGYCCDGVYTFTFSATGEDYQGYDECQVEVTVNNVNRQCLVDAGPDVTLTVPEGHENHAIKTDPDCDDVVTLDSVTVIPELKYTHVDYPGNTFYVDSTCADDEGNHTVCFWCSDEEGLVCYDCKEVFVRVGAPITLVIKKVEAYPGQQHVCVPVCLTLRDPAIEIGGWEILIKYDPVGATVVGVTPYICCPESVWAHDPHEPDLGGGEGWEWVYPLFPERFPPPEYFNYVLGADGHPNWVRVVGLMNMDWPQDVTPDIPEADNDVLFWLIVDVTPGWDGHEWYAYFEVKNCTDNTLTNSEGTILWGPTPEDQPYWLHCCYEPVVDLSCAQPDGCPGFFIRPVKRGDINCDCVAYSVADAVMFIQYLVYGPSGLSGCPSFEVHCQAADIDGDGYCFTINDLILLLRILNGYVEPLPDPKAVPTDLVVSLSDGVVSVNNEIGAARFVFAGEGEVSGEDVLFTHRDGRTIVLAYTMEDRALSGELFTIAGDVRLESVEAADFFGGTMAVKVAAIPTQFALAQNYPNPFNPETKIAFDLAKDSQVKLTVYNVTGEKVATLVNGEISAGSHVVSWNAQSVSSGVYFYTIEAGEFTATRKMILLK